MSKRQEWTALNNKLEAVGTRMLKDLQDLRPLDLQIITGFFRKSIQVLTASNLLSNSNLWDEAQILARVLFELRIKFDFFIKEALNDEEKACDLIMDAWLLQRVKELETSNWLGVTEDNRKHYTELMVNLRAKRSESEIKRIRSHGFPGRSLQQCARDLGHEVPYEVLYRRFSRGIHSSDYVEFMASPDYEWDIQYREKRDPMTAYLVHFSVGGMAEKVNSLVLKGKYNEPLDNLGNRRRKLTG